MRIPDAALDEVRERGFTVVQGVLSSDEVEAAQEHLWLHYPRPEDFFRAPESFPDLSGSGFAGLVKSFPFGGWDLTRLVFHPDLIDAAERYLSSTDLSLYKVELWAKYSGAADYEQEHHRDYGNHSLVVPRVDGVGTQLTTFTLLSDVGPDDAPTMIVPAEFATDVPLVHRRPGYRGVAVLEPGAKRHVEVPVVGPAGSVLLYRTDILHRASGFGPGQRSRFTLLADFEVRGPAWTGKVAWPNHALGDAWADMMARATVRERDLFGFPKPADPYWNAQTLADVGQRYPGMDMAPYHR